MHEDKVFETVREQMVLLMPELNPATITIDRRLADYGFNSIDRAEIVTLTLEALDLSIPVHEFGEVEDIQSLVDLIRKYR